MSRHSPAAAQPVRAQAVQRRAVSGQWAQLSGASAYLVVPVLLLVATMVLAVVGGSMVAPAPIPTQIQARSASPAVASPAQIKADYAKLASGYEANVGQAGPGVSFVDHAGGATTLLTDSGQVVVAIGSHPGSAAKVLSMGLVAANPHPAAQATGELAARTNYLIGSDPAKWHTGVSSYARVDYRAVYPGVDMVFRQASSGAVEYDLALAPGADPSVIAMAIDGTTKLSVDRSGELVESVGGARITQSRPVAYQQVGSRRIPVKVGFVLKGHNQVDFQLGPYDSHLGLVIDPVLIYSSSFGINSVGESVAVDSNGDAYVTGSASSNFPLQNPYQATCANTCAPPEAFVSELSSDGKALVYSTYLGGSGGGYGHGIAVDAMGDAYITGGTSSIDFPVKNPFQSVCANPCADGDAFVTELSPSGAGLVFSTYLGGSLSDGGQGIALEGGDIYVTGSTNSTDFPTKNAFQQQCVESCTGGSEAFVTELTYQANTLSLVYSTYLGGNAGASTSGIAVDSAGNAYVAGNTSSGDFHTTAGAFQTTCANSCNNDDAFVTKYNGQGGEVYSTFLGGRGFDQARGIAVNASGNAYVAGRTQSSDFPVTSGAYQTSCTAGKSCKRFDGNAFVTELTQDGSDLVYSTYLGGTVDDTATAIAIDVLGDAYVSGRTTSPDFPTLKAIQTTFCKDCSETGFLTKVNPQGSALVYSTYLGTEATPLAVTVDASSGAYVTGLSSEGFPTTPGAFQNADPNLQNGVFLIKIGGDDTTIPPVVTGVSPGDGPPSGGTKVTITGTGLTGASAVHFGSVAATVATSVSDTEVTAIAPPQASGPARVLVTVTTPSGTSLADPAVSYERFVYGQGLWALTGSMAVARANATATVLSGPACAAAGAVAHCGEVLAAGGNPNSTVAELYDPTLGTWSTTGSMVAPRVNFTATLLANGEVLMAGGDNPSNGPSTSEVYDPTTGTFSPTQGLMNAVRHYHTATLLEGAGCTGASPAGYCGDVLVTGGTTDPFTNDSSASLSSTELYNPTSGMWAPAANMTTARLEQSATLLPNGQVLVAGGRSPQGALASSELYDPAHNTWTLTGIAQPSVMHSPRFELTATLLGGPTCSASPAPSYCGEVLVAGGDNGASLSSAELYDPTQQTWTLTGPLIVPHAFHPAVLLDDGMVLVTGGTPTGEAANGVPPTDDTEFYDPESASWIQAAPLNVPRTYLTATLLTNGQVLAAGGDDQNTTSVNSAELFTPPPVVVSVSPSSVPSTGGTSVTITGVGFTGATGVSFNGAVAQSYQVVSDSQITAIVPAGVTSGDVVVTTPGGTSIISSADRFTAEGPAYANLSTTRLGFQTSAVGSTSPAQTVTLTNTGGVPLVVTSAVLSGANANEFTISSDTCTGASLASGGSGQCMVAVTFTPTTAATASATLTFTDSDSQTSPQTVSILGFVAGSTTGSPANASPTSVDFGTQAVGSTSSTKTVTLTNTATTALDISTVDLGGTGAAEFATTADTCSGTSVAAMGTCTVGVTFKPTAAGAASASLVFTDTASNSPQTVALTGTTPGAPPAGGGAALVRLAGANRIATAIAVSTQAFPTAGSAQAVVLARADQYPDALAGVPLAAAKGGPLLLTESASLDSATQAEIQRVLPSGATVYLLGGSGALDPSIDTALSALHYTTVRLAGTTRFGTAVAVARALGDPTQVFEVTGTNFPDAISAGPAAVSIHGAILLTNGSNQDQDTFAYLAAHTSDHRSAVGGPAATADPGAQGVGGPDRFSTSAAVATTFFPSPKALGLATGLDFPDALSGGAVVGAAGGPMLLVAPGLPLPPAVASYLSGPAKGLSPGAIDVFGGTSVVGDDVASAATTAVKGS